MSAEEYYGTLRGGAGESRRYPHRPTQSLIGWDEEYVAGLVEGIETFDEVEARVRPVPPPGSGERFGI